MAGGVQAGVGGVRAASWALRAHRATRRALRERPLHDVTVPEPPSLLPASGALAVRAVLKGSRASCLERSLVLQRWMTAHGDPRDVVIGVCGPQDFRAHAWLDGEPAPYDQGFRELTRMAP
jgi:hypothetical protein